MSTMVRPQIKVARQHGAMEYTTPPTDLGAVRSYRLGRVQQALRERDYAGALLFDPLNTRYATDTVDMQIWCMHNETRYVLVLTDGPCIVFEYGSAFHLAEGVPTVDEVRRARPFFYYASGSRQAEHAGVWAGEILDALAEHAGSNRRLAVDRMSHVGADLLRAGGVELFDGFELMENARCIKSEGEIALMRHAMDVTERGIAAMRAALTPGITENALLAKLHETNVANGGEWMETRLLASGPRTNPWMRESSMRPIEKGDMVSFDTDLVGPYGYCCDISRSWICGDVAPTGEQRTLHALAVEQVSHNMELLRPGITHREIAEKAWLIPERFRENRYGVVMHGVGLCDEIPSIKHIWDYEARGYDGVIQPGMVLCVESYMGAEGGHEGVKLEEQVLITESGIEPLSTYSRDLV
jgi:Xaa-Pro aminopeptidase